MGGNAFEDTVRLTGAEHKRVKQIVLDALMHGCIEHMLTVVASAEVLDKASFGDVDLYAAPHAGLDPEEVRRHMTDLVVQALHCPVPPRSNGSTLSFLTAERYQVDIGFTDADKLALYATVHSNGDFGLLLQISLSAVGLRLTTDGFFLRDERLVGRSVSKWDASFLLSVDAVKVGEFLGLPREAFDGGTSLSVEEVFELVVSNRFFDGGAVAAWTDHENGEVGVQGGKARKSTRRVRQRPMLKRWDEWWRATGMASYGDRKPVAPLWDNYEGVCELAVDFFEKRAEFRQWAAKLRQKVADAERVKECKSSLNFALVKGWLPDLSSMQIGEVLRKIRAEHGQYGSVELISWVRAMSPEDLRSEVLAVTRQLGPCKNIAVNDRRPVESSNFRDQVVHIA